MAEDPARPVDEIAALRLGLDPGMSPIDTAEMYASRDAGWRSDRRPAG
jgi:hypothetical protein